MEKIIDGVRLAYDDAGTGTPLVLLHGFPLDRTLWDAQAAALAADARVIRVDLRGSGASGSGVGPALMESLAGDVYGLLDALGVERAILVGHSMGGYVALAFFRMYAERVAGLGLVASSIAADSAERARARDDEAAQIAAHGMAPLIESVPARLLAAPFAAARPDAVARVRAIVARQDPGGAVAQIIGMKERLDSHDLLEDIRIPVAIVAGNEDPLAAPNAARRTAAALADGELTLLPGVGHAPPIEAPEATTAVLRRLLTRCALREQQAGETLP